MWFKWSEIVNVVLWHVGSTCLNLLLTLFFVFVLYLVETLLIYTCSSGSLMFPQWQCHTLESLHFDGRRKKHTTFVTLKTFHQFYLNYYLNFSDNSFLFKWGVVVFFISLYFAFAYMIKNENDNKYIVNIYITVLIEKNALEIHWIITSVIWFFF